MDTLVELFHQLRELLNPKIIIETLLAKGGIFVYFGLIFIIFAETGLAVGFFLPGDSLLVVAGLFAATGKLNQCHAPSWMNEYVRIALAQSSDTWKRKDAACDPRQSCGEQPVESFSSR